MGALPSALSNFSLGNCRVRAKRHSIARWQQDNGIIERSLRLHALHDNVRRQLSKYSVGTRLFSCPPAAITRGLGRRCTDTQSHRQSPKGHRISDKALIGPFRYSASKPLPCVKLHNSSVSDFPKRLQQNSAQIACNAVRSLSILQQSRHATLSVRNPHQCKSQLKERAFWGQSHQLPRLEEARPFILSSSKGSGAGIRLPWRVSGPSDRPEPGSVEKVYRLVRLEKCHSHSIEAGSETYGSWWLSAWLRIGR